MSIDTLDMFIVHRMFRNEFRAIPDLVSGVTARDVARANLIGAHLASMVTALHHHHAAEDDHLWPKLIARAPESITDIERMEQEHDAIASAVARIETLLGPWRKSGDRQYGQQLAAAAAELSVLVDEHLDDEERIALPIIEKHLKVAEWQAMLDQAASYITVRNLRSAIIMAGMVLGNTSADERRVFLSNMPMPQRLLVRFFGPRAAARQRRRLRGSP